MNVLLRITVFVVLLNIVPGWLVSVKISLLAQYHAYLIPGVADA